MIDSEQVPWGKGEKQAGEAVEIEPETICLQGTDALSLSLSAVRYKYTNACEWYKYYESEKPTLVSIRIIRTIGILVSFIPSGSEERRSAYWRMSQRV